MNRAVMGIGLGLGALVVLLAIGVVAMGAISATRQRRVYTIAAPGVPIPTDSTSLARGRHLAVAVGTCGSCHGPDLGGQVMVNSPLMARIVAPNLTRGDGGVGARDSDDDLARAIRHGVRRDGTSLIFMPSEAFHGMSDVDLGCLIAYVRSIPPVNRTLPPTSIGPLGRVMHVMGFPLLSAEIVDHAAPSPQPIPEGTLEYGHYLANVAGCHGCHGHALTGGPVGPDITVGTHGSWTEADFARVLRTGRRPDGTQLTDKMPWKNFASMTDSEVHSVWLYVRSLPPGKKKST